MAATARLVSSRGLREKGGARRELEEGFYQAALILTVLTNRLNDNDRRRPSRRTARRFSTLLTPRTDLPLFHPPSISVPFYPEGMLDQAGSRSGSAT